MESRGSKLIDVFMLRFHPFGVMWSQTCFVMREAVLVIGVYLHIMDDVYLEAFYKGGSTTGSKSLPKFESSSHALRVMSTWLHSIQNSEQNKIEIPSIMGEPMPRIVPKCYGLVMLHVIPPKFLRIKP